MAPKEEECDPVSPRFDHVFANESGAAEILLQKAVLLESPTLLVPSSDYLTLNETTFQPIAERTNFKRIPIKKRVENIETQDSTLVKHVAPSDVTDNPQDTKQKETVNFYIDKLSKIILQDSLVEYETRRKQQFKERVYKTEHDRKPKSPPIVAEIHSVRPETLITVKYAGGDCLDSHHLNSAT